MLNPSNAKVTNFSHFSGFFCIILIRIHSGVFFALPLLCQSVMGPGPQGLSQDPPYLSFGQVVS